MNYKPISLLSIGYKAFALILLGRLKEAGSDDRIWATQFGFKQNCGTIDALFMARFIIEKQWAAKESAKKILALDWAKAFDSIAPDALSDALRRIGVPKKFVKVIEHI